MTDGDLRAYAAAARHRGAQQKPEELVGLARALEPLFGGEFPWALEIGTYSGATAWFLARIGFTAVTAVDKDLSNLRLPDLPGVDFVEADSSAWAAGCDHLFDFVLVDGDHLLEGVRRDWAACRRLVRPGGMLAFHDIVEHDPPQACEVNVLWDELKALHDVIEVVEPPADWGGIGVVRL